MTRQERKRQLKTNLHVAGSVILYIYLIIAFFIKLLSLSFILLAPIYGGFVTTTSYFCDNRRL